MKMRNIKCRVKNSFIIGIFLKFNTTNGSFYFSPLFTLKNDSHSCPFYKSFHHEHQWTFYRLM